MSGFSVSQDNNPVEKKLIRCFREVFADHLPPDVTQANTSNTKTWDSMMTWTLVLLVQERFGITIGLDQIPKLTAFSAVAAYVERKLQSGKA
jgi:acyl carrier protein